MNVLMFTNTYAPHVGGVTRSVLTLRGELERRGHSVLVVAPRYPGHRQDEPGVLRMPALDHVVGSDYALPIPMSRHIRDEIEAFAPDVIHAHHPFLLGDTALRLAASLGVPAVYTAHTRFDLYAPGGGDGRLGRLMRALADGFAGIADAVIAPSESIRAALAARGVTTPIHVVPTGIDLARLAAGDRPAMRRRMGLGPEDFLTGHLGRLAAEKNLSFLGEAVAGFLARTPGAHFALSGRGPERATLERCLAEPIRAGRVHLLDNLEAGEIASFYAALDLFVFTSLTETQGLVVAEAMAAGTPVIALDSPGVRETIGTSAGGLLLGQDASPEDFAKAMAGFAGLSPAERAHRRAAARVDAARFSIEAMGAEVEVLYAELVAAGRRANGHARAAWETAWAGLATEAKLVENMLHAAGVAVRTT